LDAICVEGEVVFDEAFEALKVAAEVFERETEVADGVLKVEAE
jgi:flagellar biosynthesis regulator FlbT